MYSKETLQNWNFWLIWWTAPHPNLSPLSKYFMGQEHIENHDKRLPYTTTSLPRNNNQKKTWEEEIRRRSTHPPNFVIKIGPYTFHALKATYLLPLFDNVGAYSNIIFCSPKDAKSLFRIY